MPRVALRAPPLACMINSPNHYDPYRHPGPALARRNVVAAAVKKAVDANVPPPQAGVANAFALIAPGRTRHRGLAMVTNRSLGNDAAAGQSATSAQGSWVTGTRVPLWGRCRRRLDGAGGEPVSLASRHCRAPEGPPQP